MLSQHLRELRNFFEANVAAGKMSRENAVMFGQALGYAADIAEGMEGAAAMQQSTEEVIRQARLISGAANVVLLHAAGKLGRDDAPRGGAA